MAGKLLVELGGAPGSNGAGRPANIGRFVPRRKPSGGIGISVHFGIPIGVDGVGGIA